ncbi:MAG: transporter [Thermoleophilia bacterium]|nr:transporter [Thermoleophilia bacterium]
MTSLSPASPAPGSPETAAPHVYRRRGLIMFGIMMTTALAAIEGTIVATALPSVVRDFGSFASFPWVFSIYLLAQAVSVPFYGRLADVVGRRPVLLAGVALFLVGSLLCGVAWSMGSLIGFRALQGLGAGVVFPVTQTVMADMFDLEQRARAQGATASVWATCSVLGPALGGIFSEQLSWRWIFFINLPFGLLSIMLIARFLTDPAGVRQRRVLDVQGGISLLVGSGALMLGLLEGGEQWAWISEPSISLFAVAVLALSWCVRAESRAVDPVLPPWVVTRLPILAANVVSLAVGAIVLGLTAFFPTYAQSVIGVGPTAAGFGFAAALMGWPIAASQAGRFYLRYGFRRVAVVGAVFAICGATWLSFLTRDATLLSAAGGNFSIGIGLGLMATTSMLSVQGYVGWNERGAATGATMFARTLGSAIGTAVFGAIFHGALAGAEAPSAQLVLAGAHRVFVGMVLLSGLALAMSTLMLVRAGASFTESRET